MKNIRLSLDICGKILLWREGVKNKVNDIIISKKRQSKSNDLIEGFTDESLKGRRLEME